MRKDMKETMKYEEAVAQLESIVKSMEDGELNIDTLGEQLLTAKRLLKLCRDRLTKVENEVKLILDDAESQEK